MIAQVRRRVMHWMRDGRPEWTWWLDEHWPWARRVSLDNAVGWVLCLAAGHEPVADNCGMPEHDRCAWCSKPMPGAAARTVASC